MSERNAAKLQGLYVIIDPEVPEGRAEEEIARQAIEGGARLIQLRDKQRPKGTQLEVAQRLREVCARAGVPLIINDHLDVALAVGADGVHLGTDDLPLSAARALAPELLLGASTHYLAEAREAEVLGADYVNIGPIFPTTTKEKLSRFLGPQAVSEIAPQISIPFTVMGGINLDNLDAILRAGARRIALVTAVTRAPDPARAARALRERILGYPAGHSS